MIDQKEDIKIFAIYEDKFERPKKVLNYDQRCTTRFGVYISVQFSLFSA